MKNLRVKLFDLDSLKWHPSTEYRKTHTSYSVKRFSKAIVFKDCEPKQANYMKISKLQKVNESFKISSFNLSENKTQEPLNNTQHVLRASPKSTPLAKTRVIEKVVKNRFPLTPNIFLKRFKSSEKKISSNSSKATLISPIFITKLTNTNTTSERLLKQRENHPIISILHST